MVGILLFINHLHIDHIAGLHILSKFNFKNKMSIVYHSLKQRKDAEQRAQKIFPDTTASYDGMTLEL